MNIAVFSFKSFEKAFLEKANTQSHHLFYYNERLTSNTIHLANNCEAIFIFTNDDLGKENLHALNKAGVKYICSRSAGTDNIDLQEAGKLGIKIANVPAYSPNAIAEHVFALLLSLARKVIESHQKIAQNNFDLTGLVGFELTKKTIGIIGMGKIGYHTARIANGFDMNILAYDLVREPEYEKELNLNYTDLNTIYQSCDIISLHVPLNKETTYMINKDSIDQMKDGVIIVNTARGGLIKTSDLITALEDGKVKAAALDVYEKEKGLFFYDYTDKTVDDAEFIKLRALPNVIITGHQGFLTETALKNIADTTLYNINSWANGNKSINELI